MSRAALCCSVCLNNDLLCHAWKVSIAHLMDLHMFFSKLESILPHLHSYSAEGKRRWWRFHEMLHTPWRCQIHSGSLALLQCSSADLDDVRWKVVCDRNRKRNVCMSCNIYAWLKYVVDCCRTRTFVSKFGRRDRSVMSRHIIGLSLGDKRSIEDFRVMFLIKHTYNNHACNWWFADRTCAVDLDWKLILRSWWEGDLRLTTPA